MSMQNQKQPAGTPDQTPQTEAPGVTSVRKPFVEPAISHPVDVLEATTFFQVVDSGGTGLTKKPTGEETPKGQWGGPARLVHLAARAARWTVAAPRELALTIRMAFWVVVVTVVARLTSLPRTQRLATFTLRSTAASHPADTPARLARAIDRLLGLDLFVFRPTCWKRALVLHRFLALHGIESRINFGVQKASDGSVSGHAWLERQGQPFLERDAGVYTVTFSLPYVPEAAR